MIITMTEQREENKSKGKKKGKAERRGRGRPLGSLLHTLARKPPSVRTERVSMCAEAGSVVGTHMGP